MLFSHKMFVNLSVTRVFSQNMSGFHSLVDIIMLHTNLNRGITLSTTDIIYRQKNQIACLLYGLAKDVIGIIVNINK